MRVLIAAWSAFALLLGACGSTAAQNNAAASEAAGLTLRYANPERAEDSLLIERDSAGRVRAEDGRGQLVFVRDGVGYLAWTPPGPGGRITARLDDIAAVGAELRARLLEPGALSGTADTQAYRVEDEGEATVGRWHGRRYSLHPELSGPTFTATLSSDPALAEPRALIVSVLDALETPARSVLIYPENYLRQRDALLRRGTVLSYDGSALTAMEAAPIPAARFDLPGPVLNREALRARLLR